MFLVIGILFFLAGAIPFIWTIFKKTSLSKNDFSFRIRFSVAILFLTGLFLLALNLFFRFYSEYLWFENLGFERRFWTILFAKSILFIIGYAISFVFFAGFLKFMFSNEHEKVWIPSIFLAFLTGVPFYRIWDKTLLFFFQSKTNVQDPVFGKQIGFYLFSLPFYSAMIQLLFLLLILVVVVIAGFSFYKGYRKQKGLYFPKEFKKKLYQGGVFAIAVFLFLFGINQWLNRYYLLFSQKEILFGAGYIEVYVQRYLYYLIFLISLTGASFLFWKVFKNNFGIFPGKKIIWSYLALIVFVMFLNNFLPPVLTSLIVKPNEITMQKPFIRNHIEFTQKGYALTPSRLVRKNYILRDEISSEVLKENAMTLKSIRLWDWRALLNNLEEQQEIRLYYKFHDVDIDRYVINGEYRQVMLAVRELEKQDLVSRSQTWVSRHFKYTHGYGLVLLPVSEFLPEGEPNLLIRNIPPESGLDTITIKHPEIYFGELTRDHVYVRTELKEFDYPLGDKNVLSTYNGKGGVLIDSWIKRVIFAWKFDGYKLLFTRYLTDNSKILFRRQIRDRVKSITPFLEFDRDPFAVITENGRIKYMLDAYTTSGYFPYSERYRGILRPFYGINYIRNSVKIVIDAYDGTVEYYITDPDDPIIKTYDKIYPDVFKPVSEMPKDLLEHIRYPVDYFMIQSEMYRTFHMSDPQVFYQQEDVWEMATEKYRDSFQRIRPYYVMLSLPETAKLEFVLMLPFTPNNKNVMNAWIAARCDPANYGELMVVSFPKGEQILGPRQIEARIDQNTEMSQAMTLWGQKGSEVIRGNLLTIPLFYENELYILYVEPVFLQAENANLPEIKRIILADQTQVVWGVTFEDALNRLIQGELEERALKKVQQITQSLKTLVRRAAENFSQWEKYIKEFEYSKAGKALESLKETVEEMVQAIKEDQEETS